MEVTAIPSPAAWRHPPERLVLSKAEVHVWRAALDLECAPVQNFERTLATDERARAARFHFDTHRNQFIVGRGVLRTILGRYLGIEPDRLQFRYSSHGKPALSAEQGSNAIRFNVSHSGGMALYAVTRERKVGVDLERIRPDFANEEIAERFFSPQEVAAFHALPPESRLEAFFACWTRKEAYIKARGEGLSLPLDRFDVSLAPGQPAALMSVHDDHREAARWSIRELSPGPDYVAAIAAEGHDWRLECWQWHEP